MDNILPQRSHPVGVPYPNYARMNMLHAQGSVMNRAVHEGVSESTIRRVDRLFQETGSVQPRPHGGGTPKKLTPHEAGLLAWFLMNYPQASNKQLQDFIRAASGRDVIISSSTASEETKRLGFSEKALRYYSMYRDEPDRVKFWCNAWNHPQRPGVAGVSYRDIVDIDESGFNPSRANRRKGRSLIGTPARARGRIARNEVSYTLLVAVDARVGVVNRLIFEGGCTSDIFFIFIVLFVLPSIRHTGPRIITVDNLGAHCNQELKALAAAEGHQIIFRPIHSPDFGPVEWVFHAATQYLEHHDHLINGDTLRPALNAFLDLLPADEIAAYFACAHFAVPGHEYDPYLGQN